MGADKRKVATFCTNNILLISMCNTAKAFFYNSLIKDFELINLKPRHARLTFNAAHSLSIYILELMDQP